jgi:hypothetical protein
MTSFFKTPPRATTQPPQAATTLRLQTSVLGRAVAIGWGKQRVVGNLIGYWDFTATPVWQQQQTGGGGKGPSGGGGKGTGGAQVTSYTYSAAVAIGLCEGPISNVTSMWYNKSHSFNPSSDLNLVQFNGGYSQTSWGYLASLHPGDAYNYRGLAYEAAGPMQLGNNPELPNMTFEVVFAINSSPGTSDPVAFPAAAGDANPRDVVTDFLTNPFYGLGFAASLLDPMNVYYAYCVVTRQLVSPVLDTQMAARSFLGDLMTATNSEFVWSQGTLKVVPYGDTDISDPSTGYSYTATAAPLYSLGDDDFKRSGTTSHDAPVIVTRKRIADQSNHVSIEFLDRGNDYNPSIVEVKDDAAIQLFGLKKKDLKTLHMFCYSGFASAAASLMLGREKISNTFSFVLGPEFIVLDPMDIVAITDTALGLNGEWVRIKEITENQDATLTILAEEYPFGSGSSPIYGTQPQNGALPNYNADPGNILAPVFYEPPDALAGGLAVWGSVAPVNTNTWGGADIYTSSDGVNYVRLERKYGPTRMGVLTAPLASVTPSSIPPTQDLANTLSVDLTKSASDLLSGSHTDLLSGNTLCLVGSQELLAYQNAALTASHAYNLTTLSRGLYGTSPSGAANGANFIRLDEGVVKIPYTQDRIGQTLYIKFVGFNKYGGNGQQSLASATPYTYIFTGAALSSPLPDVTGFTTVFQSGVTTFSWTEVTDFRPVLYEIRKGTTWQSAPTLGLFAHPGVVCLGDDTYWIAAYTQPVSGLVVYSANPASLTVVGAVIPLNVKATWDEFATGVTGTLTNLIYDGVNITTFGLNDILSFSDVFAIGTVADSTVTISIASPGVVTWANHGLGDGQNIALATTGALPTGLTPLVTYYLVNTTTNTFQLATTPGGLAINTSGSQSGTHHAYAGGDVYSGGATAQSNGNYEIPTGHQIDVGYVAPCLVAITFTAEGVASLNNFFAYNPLFDVADFFASSGNRFIGGTRPQIALSQDGVTWAAWQNYVPGVYNARKFKARMMVESSDPNTEAVLSSFIFSVNVPTRVDSFAIIGGVRTSLNNLSLAAGGATLTFQPDYISGVDPRAFNGGTSNNSASTPSVSFGILNEQNGDRFVITGLTLSGMTVQVINAGIGVARSVFVRPEGY